MEKTAGPAPVNQKAVSPNKRTTCPYKRTAALHNLGCKVNAYETEAMEQLLEEAGYRIVPFDSPADVYVINTCSVTNIADRKSRQMLSRARKQNPQAVVVAAGCYVQTAHDKTHLKVDADVIIGNNRKKDLVGILETFFKDQKMNCQETDRKKTVGEDAKLAGVNAEITDISHDTSYEELFISRTSEHTRAFIKVQDGCNQFCSYCIIPYARGRIRSRDMGDVVREVTKLTAAGVKEIVLTGIHLSSYGLDGTQGKPGTFDLSGSSDREGDRQSFLLDLIRAVADVPGVERIRLGSLEPRIITRAFAEELRKIPQLCPHFHLSLQSGSDSVLRRMNRKYTTAEYTKACGILREEFEDPALTTDVIVGFPGESEEEFAETKAYLENLKLYETHIFKYSRREGTRAAAMPGQLTEREKNKRSAELIALGKQNCRSFIRKWDGKQAEVLFEEVWEPDHRHDLDQTQEFPATDSTQSADLPQASELPAADSTQSADLSQAPDLSAAGSTQSTNLPNIESGCTQKTGAAKYYTGYTREYIRVYMKSEADLTNKVVRGTLDCLRPDHVMLRAF